MPPNKRVNVQRNALLEDFPVGPLVSLPADVDRLVPRPLILHEFAVFLAAGVKLDELVALEVRCDVESGLSVLATSHESTTDDRVPSHTVHGQAAEKILARSFETSEEPT